MSNTNPITYDKFLQIRTDPVWREKLEEMVNATGEKQTDIIREAVEEKYARWKRKAAAAR